MLGKPCEEAWGFACLLAGGLVVSRKDRRAIPWRLESGWPLATQVGFRFASVSSLHFERWCSPRCNGGGGGRCGAAVRALNFCVWPAGGSAGEEGQPGLILAFQAFQLRSFSASLTAPAYHLGVMQRGCIHNSGPAFFRRSPGDHRWWRATAAASNVFRGMNRCSPIRPYLAPTGPAP